MSERKSSASPATRSSDVRFAHIRDALQSCFSSGSFNQELDALVSVLNDIPISSLDRKIDPDAWKD